MFHFKQFSIDQRGCAMKINTDGVLLGALAKADDAATILDIGTGTGVIALMLAQRFVDAKIDAVEIDEDTAKTAAANFTNSPFKQRLTAYPEGFADFFSRRPDKKYDLVISNPPFHLHSLKSPGKSKALAKHADESLFEELVAIVARHLTGKGVFYLILPVQTASLVKALVDKNNLCLYKIIKLYSYSDGGPHREILAIGMDRRSPSEEKFVIYSQPNQYSGEYREALKDFLTIF